MDVFSALQTSVSGLSAQAYALDNISGNIANSQTVGFKRTDTNFVDLVAEQPLNQQVSGSVAGFSSLTTTLAGNIASTGIATNMALNGSGFFTVQGRTSDAGGTTVFTGQDLYTRRGDFTLDKDGYLVNGAGYFLSGSTLDPTTGQANGSGIIKISNASIAAKATTAINYTANLPTTPQTANYSASSTGSELYSKAGATFTTATGTGTVASADVPAFVRSSIDGPSLTLYTDTGTPVTVQTRWAKVQNASGSAQDTWNLFYNDTSATSTSNGNWTNVGTSFAFDNGQLTQPSASTTPSITIPNLSVNGTSVGNIALTYGSGGLTEYADSSGKTTTNTLKQDGYGAGTLNTLSVGADGKISGSYSNGSTQVLAQVGVVQFTGAEFLKAGSAGTYEQTLESGPPLSGLNGTTVVGGNVEQSNTDIAKEFSKMIVTQQAYSANTRVMTTAQQMISDLLNVIR